MTVFDPMQSLKVELLGDCFTADSVLKIIFGYLEKIIAS